MMKEIYENKKKYVYICNKYEIYVYIQQNMNLHERPGTVFLNLCKLPNESFRQLILPRPRYTCYLTPRE